MPRAPLLVFSHLRWDFVFQRPQHLISRLARTRRILYVEEPVASVGRPSLEIRQVAPGIEVATPHLDDSGRAFGITQEGTVLSLLRNHLDESAWPRFAAWLYTPMAVRVACALGAQAIVYDCMDELSAFLGAPPEMLNRERELLKVADAVFTGGPSLYRAKKPLHPSVHCFPSSVDIEHFSKAASLAEPEDQAVLRRPRLGYFGVIDERLDFEIIDRIAVAHPQWQIILVGPVVKIDASTLPLRPNIHYLGQRPYRDLPALVGGWDVGLMPFVLNASTGFINPTKALEYMAAGRPIVSTPIHDVAELYGDIVYVGDGPEGFQMACERALIAFDAERERRRAAQQRVLENTSWDATVTEMDAILSAIADRERVPATNLAPLFGMHKNVRRRLAG